MTLNEQFAGWLADTMRAAGLEIDRQRGGGRMTLATAVGVSPSTVARWLDAKSLPSPEYYESLADALGVPAGEMLVKTGILSAESLQHTQRSGVRSQPITAEQLADELCIHDPADRAEFIRELQALTARHLRAASDGETDEAVAT